MATNKPPPTLRVLVDSREQRPLDLSKCPEVESLAKVALKTGDYTTQALRDLVVIERKSLQDMASSVSKARFLAELERSREFREFHLVIDDAGLAEVLDYPFSTTMPRSVKAKIRIRGLYILSKLIAYRADFPHVSIWPAQSRTVAAKLVVQILKQAEARYLTLSLPATPICDPQKESA